MDQTAPSSAPAPTGGAIGMMGTITVVHLALIALLALIVVVALIYGVRQRRLRRRAEHVEEARMDALGAQQPIREAEPDITSSGQEEQRPPAALRPAPADRTADLPGRGATSSADPARSQAPVTDRPRHDPVPPREQATAAAPRVPLTQIKGLGPKVQARLAELGVTCVDQIAALSDDEAEALDAKLGAFRGRIIRDRWVEQARFLAAGDVKGFEAVFGRL